VDALGGGDQSVLGSKTSRRTNKGKGEMLVTERNLDPGQME